MNVVLPPATLGMLGGGQLEAPQPLPDPFVVAELAKAVRQQPQDETALFVAERIAKRVDLSG